MLPVRIDAVIPWVDGSDRALNAERSKYASPSDLSDDNVAGPGRYSQIGEIRYCVASILRFAPFIRKIFIVADSQEPGLSEMLFRYFPDRAADVVTVDHKTIFRGWEDALPVFNSRAIETLIWNIPELSRHFVLFNDDFMLVKETSREDFFLTEDTPVCYGTMMPVWFERFLRALKPSHIGFKAAMLKAVELYGVKSPGFINLGHTPRPLLKDWFEEWAVRREDMVRLNISYKFRSAAQFQTQEAFYMDMLERGKLKLVSDREAALYFRRRSNGYTASKLASFERDKKRKFVCFNALNYCPESEQAAIFGWLSSRIGIDLTF